MTPTAIIRQAQADGVTLALSSAGTIKATGNGEAVNRWLPVIREHKAELLAVVELARLIRLYADHHGFSTGDHDELMEVALRNVEGWLIYLRTQPECRTVH